MRSANAIKAKIRTPVLPIAVVAILAALVATTYVLAPGSVVQSDANADLERLAATADAGGSFHVNLTVNQASAGGNSVTYSKELWVDHAAGRLRAETRNASGVLTKVRAWNAGEIFEVSYDVHPPRFFERRYLDPRIAERQLQEDDLFLFKVLMDSGVITSSQKVAVENQDAIKLEVSPFGEDAGHLVAYIDTERGWPIKLELYDDEASVPTSSTTFRYDRVEPLDGAALSDDYFTLKPPPDANVYMQVEMSADEARAFADFPVYWAGEALLDVKLDRIQQLAQQSSISGDVNQVSVIYWDGRPQGHSVTITNLPGASVSAAVPSDQTFEAVATKVGQARFYPDDGRLEIQAGTMLVLVNGADKAEALAFSEALTRLNKAPDPTPVLEEEIAPTPRVTPTPKPAPDPILVPEPTTR